MTNKIITFLTITFFISNIHAQYLNPQSVKSPNVESMDRFGDIPINLFTGTPDISIPLYEMQYGNIKVPIGLRYHASSVKPNQAPGWVGLGWDLSCSGTINREVRGNYDEHTYIPPSSYAAIISYLDGGANAIESNSNWFTSATMYTQNEVTNYSDQQADEFSFNFLGHSGKFYYEGSSKGWVVDSDENIKVEVNGFITPHEYISTNALYQYLTYSGDYWKTWREDNEERFFKEFTLITQDGSRYTFGGLNAIEFTSNYKAQVYKNVNLSSWLLKKIEDSNGKIVIYNYKRDYPNVSLSHYCDSYSSSQSDQKWSWVGAWTAIKGSNSFSTSELINEYRLGGSFIFPMYLTSIESDLETISFTSVPATTLTYNAIQFSSAAHPWDTPTEENEWLPNLKWNKLTNLEVTDKFSNNNIKKISFEYFENPNQRFALSRLNILSTNVINYKKYDFVYDDITSLPLYGGNYIDHWGFFNNTNIGTALNTAFTNRQANPNFVTKGLLTQITYPTGGMTNFIWEAHKHSRVLSDSKNTLLSNVGYAGGCRIKEIKSYSDLGVLASQKKYYYVSGYNSTLDPTALSSSGILNGIPKYSFSFSNYYGKNNVTTFSFDIFSLNSIANNNPAGNGSPIGYDEVVEVNLDNSYTKHFFTNYGADINAISHFDQAPLGYTGWHVGDQNVYMQYSSLERERGKEIGVFDYNSQDVLVKKKKIIFRNDSGRFNEFLKQKIKSSEYNSTGDALMFAVAIKNFIYDYYPINEEVTYYGVNGTNPIIQTRTFSYNSKNQLSVEQKSTSVQTNIYQTKYYYPPDSQVAYEPNVSNLISKNIIGSPLKTETYFNAELLSSQTTTFGSFPSTTPSYLMFLPQYIYAKKGSVVPDQNEKKVTYKYDDKGNIIEYTPENGVSTCIIWGYKKTQPIAKIENVTYSQIVSFVSNLQALSDTGTEAGLLTALNALRSNASLVNTFVSTYTYKPLIGVSTITDQKGDQISYFYDSLNRLKWVKDKSGNILSENQYHYKN